THEFLYCQRDHDKFRGFAQRSSRIGLTIRYYKFDELSAETRHFGQRTYA
ncbi:hypothetical protein Goari_014579, partial [Gossypium aridum]|nr:hypothetical protein [Gossypium aridum]